MKSKKETWLVFYRTKSGKLCNMEVDGELSKATALRLACLRKGFKNLELGPSGPIIKRLVYV